MLWAATSINTLCGWNSIASLMAVPLKVMQDYGSSPGRSLRVSRISLNLVVWKESHALFNRSNKRGAEVNFLARKGEVN